MIRPTPSAQDRHRRGGFTLIEMLVVVGIILILVAILLPSIFAMRRQSERYRTQGDLNVIVQACYEYKKDFKDIPRQPLVARNDRTILAWALMGPYDAVKVGSVPGDGADGIG